MTESVIMNLKTDRFVYGESRTQPFIVWLQFMNFAVVTALCWLFLKMYKMFSSFCEWIFPLRCNQLYNPVILVIGDKNELNEEIVRQLSYLFNSKVVTLMELNDGILVPEVNEKKNCIIYTQVKATSQAAASKISENIRRVFGEIDLLLISPNEEHASNEDDTHRFLNNLNKQLLAQFWTVMAFLPGMFQRNSGRIVSLALGRTSSLTNTGIVRSVCEELLLSDTKVKLTLVERNSFVENYLPALPSDVLARLIIRSIWTSNTFVHVPSISQYLLMMPLVITRSLLQPIIRVLSIGSTQPK